jgi:beta-lactamase class A
VIQARLEHALRASLDEAGLRGSFLVRDLPTGDELGLDADVERPVASLVKVPLAVAVAERIEAGELEPAAPLDIAPGRITAPGPMGVTRFRHPARIALEDVLYLATSMSDNVAADALFDLVPPAAVMQTLEHLELTGIAVRHRIQPLAETPAQRFAGEEVHLAQELAIQAGTSGGGHPVAQLDTARANTGTASAFVALLDELWAPRSLRPAAAARVRDLLRHNVLRQRLAPDFSADNMTWSSKTGTLLNLRHEIGVVEHADGQRFAVAALTESIVPAAVQPAAEARMALIARRLHDELRAR